VVLLVHGKDNKMIEIQNKNTDMWYTKSDYSPSYLVRINIDKIELLGIQDIWPGYEGAKEIKIEQHHIDYIQSEKINLLIKYYEMEGEK